jgi:hypothetical protein
MQGNGSAFCGSATSLEVRYTDKPVSGWGGLVAVMRYLEKRGVRQVLAQALPDGRTSPNQIPVAIPRKLGSAPCRPSKRGSSTVRLVGYRPSARRMVLRI